MDARITDNNSAGDLEAIHAEARAWARRLKLEQPTTADAEAFKRWRAQSPVHAHAWAQAGSDWRDLQQIALAYQASQPSAAARTPAQMRRRHGSVQLGRRLFLGSALSVTGAAAFAAIVHPPMGLWPSWSELHADYRTGTGEQRDIALPGGMQLSLNTQTSVSMPAAPDMRRLVLLTGEAVFENRGEKAGENVNEKRIELTAGAGRVYFNNGVVELRCIDDRVRVRCLDGEMEVQHPLNSLTGVALQAGQQISYSRDTLSAASRFNAKTVSAWRQGMVEFDDTPLPEAVAEINRYRPGWVVLMNDRLAGRRISGRFRIAALDEAVTQIQALFSTGVRTVGGVVLLG
jgi:transmembrane sensor